MCYYILDNEVNIDRLWVLLETNIQEDKMNRIKKLLALLLAAVMVFSMAACGGNAGTTETEAVSAEAGTYTVSVKSAGGMALEGIAVYIYVDSTLADLKQYGETNAEGIATFTMAQSSDYAIALSGVPKGYAVDDSYAFNGSSAAITLTSSVIQGESLSGATLGLGDVMYDFSVLTPSGDKVTLSEMLEEKEMVLLNFWYTTCSWCATEFPYMEEAYQMYQEDVGIIALDPLSSMDSDAGVAAFQAQYGLSFPMAMCQPAWSTTFGISGYPTSIVVDRYGVICLVESGALTSLRPFVSIFETFTGDDYEQKLYGSVSELVTTIKPTYEMDTSENVAAVLNSAEYPITYRPEEGDSAEYSWPFIATEKNGETCLKASNQEIEDSYAILYADVELKAGQAVGFDYLASSERSADVLFVIVDNEDIYQISGTSETEEWKSCYPWVAVEDGTYEVALCYLKDESTNEGDDTVYVKNMHIVDAEDIDTETYIPRNAATTKDGFEYDYVEIVLNEEDNYYHVGTANGPLLLANLMGYTQFNEESTVWNLAYDGIITVDGHNYYDELVEYCNYASNSSLSGYCTVNKELGDLLKIVADVAGFDGTENEWLKICSYYQVYGSDSKQLEDPIIGLAPFCAYEAKLGKNVESNYFYYNRAIIPRGLMAEFIPTRSGVYRITSRNDSQQGVEGWIFNENKEELYVYEQSERLYDDSNNVSMLYYMEAGTPYYIDIAFWDIYEVGYIYYDIEDVGATMNLFRSCAPGYFTYDTNATGDAMYHLINGGIDVILGEDGKYYEDLGLDANGKQQYGSLIYCDFVGLTSLFSRPIATVASKDDNGNIVKDADGNTVMITGMIDMGGFDFSKTEGDLYILAFLEKRDNDVEVTDAYLRELWGDEYDAYAEIYQLQDVYEGIYHGSGEDLTEEIRTYLDDIITNGKEELQGCVVVTERLAEILQMLMDKYTFENVDDSWIKMCYYYQYLGPNK